MAKQMAELPLTRRLLEAYGRVHPSTLQYVKWRISKENCRAVAKENWIDDVPDDLDGLDAAGELRMLGIPVKLVEGDEILLVVVVA